MKKQKGSQKEEAKKMSDPTTVTPTPSSLPPVIPQPEYRSVIGKLFQTIIHWFLNPPKSNLARIVAAQQHTTGKCRQCGSVLNRDGMQMFCFICRDVTTARASSKNTPITQLTTSIGSDDCIVYDSYVTFCKSVDVKPLTQKEHKHYEAYCKAKGIECRTNVAPLSIYRWVDARKVDVQIAYNATPINTSLTTYAPYQLTLNNHLERASKCFRLFRNDLKTPRNIVKPFDSPWVDSEKYDPKTIISTGEQSHTSSCQVSKGKSFCTCDGKKLPPASLWCSRCDEYVAQYDKTSEGYVEHKCNRLNRANRVFRTHQNVGYERSRNYIASLEGLQKAYTVLRVDKQRREQERLQRRAEFIKGCDPDCWCGGSLACAELEHARIHKQPLHVHAAHRAVWVKSFDGGKIFPQGLSTPHWPETPLQEEATWQRELATWPQVAPKAEGEWLRELAMRYQYVPNKQKLDAHFCPHHWWDAGYCTACASGLTWVDSEPLQVVVRDIEWLKAQPTYFDYCLSTCKHGFKYEDCVTCNEAPVDGLANVQICVHANQRQPFRFSTGETIKMCPDCTMLDSRRQTVLRKGTIVAKPEPIPLAVWDGTLKMHGLSMSRIIDKKLMYRGTPIMLEKVGTEKEEESAAKGRVHTSGVTGTNREGDGAKDSCRRDWRGKEMLKAESTHETLTECFDPYSGEMFWDREGTIHRPGTSNKQRYHEEKLEIRVDVEHLKLINVLLELKHLKEKATK